MLISFLIGSVPVPPYWLSQPPAETIQTVSGHSVELTCHVHGVPPPQVTWSFTQGKNYKRCIPSSIRKILPLIIIGVERRSDKKSDKYTTLFNTNRTLLANQSLIISPVDMSDQGYYQCEAFNGIGTSINALISLQVHGIGRASFIIGIH